MLTAKNRTAHQAIDYFSQGYSTPNQTRWCGIGAEKLGLSGQVNQKETFTNICNGLSPDGTVKLSGNTKRAAIDCTFSAPKSVSLSALVGGDERLVLAHQRAVEETLSLIEQQQAQTRVQVRGNRLCVKTGNLIVAQFDHIESRELDPHLHTHALIMNLTKAENGRWYSLYNKGIYKNKKTFGMFYQSHLMSQVQKLGYQTIARDHNQFEIAGYRKQDLVEFSKRRQQIILEVGKGASWVTRENAWSITRISKQYLSPDDLKQAWKQETKALGIVPVTLQSQLEEKDKQLQANIQSFLQLSDQDLLLMDRFLKDYFQSPEAKAEVGTSNYQDKKELLEALQSPQVRQQVETAERLQQQLKPIRTISYELSL